ncbi:MAG TPA: GGDEF domain-containing protein [Terriglobales bacterium]|jgi:diguanylate cyclase (GGDEF)-like protein|nr:GGDEF domain-containing protein [Terriglobales bacterium]
MTLQLCVQFDEDKPSTGFGFAASLAMLAEKSTIERNTSLERPSLRRQELDAGEPLRIQIARVESQDVHLWSIAALVGVLLAAGFVGLVVPNLVWQASLPVFANIHYLPHLLLGFIGVILIFNLYIFEERRKLNWTREELIRQWLRGDAAERLALIDPMTEAYNRRFMEEVLVKEASRTNRTGADLSLLMIDVDNFREVNSRFGHQHGDLILVEIAKLLKSTFRGSDSVVRYGGDEFLVILPDTGERQAQQALQRLADAVERWNAAGNVPGYRMSLSCGVATYQRGMDLQQLINLADERMYTGKSRESKP